MPTAKFPACALATLATWRILVPDFPEGLNPQVCSGYANVGLRAASNSLRFCIHDSRSAALCSIALSDESVSPLANVVLNREILVRALGTSQHRSSQAPPLPQHQNERVPADNYPSFTPRFHQANSSRTPDFQTTTLP